MEDEKTLSSTTTSELPGFRFHPTEEELLNFYLRSIVFGKRSQFHVIGFLNIYRHDPRDLPGLAKIGEREWYFFVPRDRKQSNGGRPNRTTEHGFWKATGSDRKVVSLSEPKRVIGYRKTLVFYKGRAPRGTKTDWVMNEYRLPDNQSNLPKDVVLCKVYRKATSLKVLEEWAAMEEKEVLLKSTQLTYQFQSDYSSNYPSSPVLSSNNLNTTNTTTTARSKTTASASTVQQDRHHPAQPISSTSHVVLLPHLPKKEEEEPLHQTTPDLQKIYDEIMAAESIGGHSVRCCSTSTSTSLKSPFGIPEIQVPGKVDSSSSLWVQDIFGPQIRSPFLDIFNLFTPSPNLRI